MTQHENETNIEEGCLTALIYAYEHKELRPKEFISSNSKLHPSTALKALSDLTTLELLERHADSPTSPNTYYTLKAQK